MTICFASSVSKNFFVGVPGAVLQPVRLEKRLCVACRYRPKTNGTHGRSQVFCRQSSREVVSELLKLLEEHDGGPSTPPKICRQIDDLVLELRDREESKSHLDDPTIFDQYEVSYVNSADRVPPAGGRFRGVLGRLVFRGRGVYQHVFKPNHVVNIVAFRLFNLVPGLVVLRGVFTTLDSADVGSNAIRVDFAAPRIALWGFVFQFGKPSDVTLRVVHLDERVRVGIGSRGSLFVFSRLVGASNLAAKEWKPMFQDDTKPLPVAVLLAVLVGLIVASIYATWQIVSMLWISVIILCLRSRRQFVRAASC